MWVPTRVRKTSPDNPTARCVGVAGYKCEPDPTGWNNVGDMPTTKATHYVVVFQCGRTHGLRGRGMLVRLQPITPKKIKKPLDKWLKMWYNKLTNKGEYRESANSAVCKTVPRKRVVGSAPTSPTTSPSLIGKQKIQPVRVGQGRIKIMLDKPPKVWYNQDTR